MTSKTYTAKRRDFTPKADSLLATFVKAIILASTGYLMAWLVYLAA